MHHRQEVIMSQASEAHRDLSPLDIHLDPEEMSRLVRLDCSHAEAFEWLAHLVACRICRNRLARHFPCESRRILDRFLLLHDRADNVEIHPSTYDRVFKRAHYSITSST